MIPHKLIKETDELFRALFEPVRMKIVTYNEELPYEEWLAHRQIECDDRYSHLFVLKIKE